VILARSKTYAKTQHETHDRKSYAELAEKQLSDFTAKKIVVFKFIRIELPGIPRIGKC